MPIMKPKTSYIPLFEYYECCICYEPLEYNTMIYDFNTLKYHNMCKTCDLREEAYPYWIKENI